MAGASWGWMTVARASGVGVTVAGASWGGATVARTSGVGVTVAGASWGGETVAGASWVEVTMAGASGGWMTVAGVICHASAGAKALSSIQYLFRGTIPVASNAFFKSSSRIVSSQAFLNSGGHETLLMVRLVSSLMYSMQLLWYECLRGLKTTRSSGCKMCVVWEGRVRTWMEFCLDDSRSSSTS